MSPASCSPTSVARAVWGHVSMQALACAELYRHTHQCCNIGKALPCPCPEQCFQGGPDFAPQSGALAAEIRHRPAGILSSQHMIRKHGIVSSGLQGSTRMGLPGTERSIADVQCKAVRFRRICSPCSPLSCPMRR